MPPKKREPTKHKTSPQVPEAVRHNQEELRAQLAHFEVAWIEWSRTVVKDLDARTMLLLRAAFQAGYDARR